LVAGESKASLNACWKNSGNRGWDNKDSDAKEVAGQGVDSSGSEEKKKRGGSS